MLLSNVLGLKFPDEYLTRFFFKQNLQKVTGRVLELGCGNGNNLNLFYQYGWDVVGVDLDSDHIKAANHNLSALSRDFRLPNIYEFVLDDMLEYISRQPVEQNGGYDCLVLASSIYYLEYEKIVRLLSLIRDKNLIRPGADIYVRYRTDKDYRFGKGRKLSAKSFKLDISETGEKGCEMTFFDQQSFMELFQTHLPLIDVKDMNLRFDNIQNDILVENSDRVVWGRFDPK